MNPEQVKGSLRYLIATFGGMFAGWFAAKGYFTADQFMAIVTSEAFIGLVASGVVAVWGVINRSDKNTVALANATPGVKGVITESTEVGKALAASIPAPTVVAAGTTEAVEIAKVGGSK